MNFRENDFPKFVINYEALRKEIVYREKIDSESTAGIGRAFCGTPCVYDRPAGADRSSARYRVPGDFNYHRVRTIYMPGST